MTISCQIRPLRNELHFEAQFSVMYCWQIERASNFLIKLLSSRAGWRKNLFSIHLCDGVCCQLQGLNSFKRIIVGAKLSRFPEASESTTQYISLETGGNSCRHGCAGQCLGQGAGGQTCKPCLRLFWSFYYRSLHRKKIRDSNHLQLLPTVNHKILRERPLLKHLLSSND